MNWIITEDKTSINGLRINFNPPNNVLTFFFASLKTIDFSDYILQILNSKGGFGIENTTILFYNQMDWEDKKEIEIAEGDVYISSYDGRLNHTILSEIEFDEILYDFSLKIIQLNHENHLLPKDWVLNTNDSLEKLKNKITKNELGHFYKPRVNNLFIFFDGLNIYKVSGQYYDWLSSDDYAVWSNSYVEIQNKRIYIIKENVKILSTFRYFRKEELELLAIQYNLKIKEKDSIYYAYSEPHSDGQYQICENDQLTVIYGTNGSYGPESIFIYGVFEK